MFTVSLLCHRLAEECLPFTGWIHTCFPEKQMCSSKMWTWLCPFGTTALSISTSVRWMNSKSPGTKGLSQAFVQNKPFIDQHIFHSGEFTFKPLLWWTYTLINSIFLWIQFPFSVSFIHSFIHILIGKLLLSTCFGRAWYWHWGYSHKRDRAISALMDESGLYSLKNITGRNHRGRRAWTSLFRTRCN